MSRTIAGLNAKIVVGSGLVAPAVDKYADVLRDCYESYTIYSFYMLVRCMTICRGWIVVHLRCLFIGWCLAVR